MTAPYLNRSARLAVGAVCALLFVLLLAACGGDGGSASTSSTTLQNVQLITVDAGPANNDSNVGFISVTVCAPGTGNCQTIDHIAVDTGSSGLRLIASVLSPSLGLTQQTGASGQPLVECTQFADGFVWGPVKLADLTIAGEQAKSLPIQVIGDPAFPNVPGDCSSSGPNEDSISVFGANGIIGVGPFQPDCGTVCANFVVPGAYYLCPASGCSNTTVAVTSQVQNPVGLFAIDNNGVVILMNSVAAAGQNTVNGSLIFGIGTQTNNGLGNARVLPVATDTGYLTTIYNNTAYPHSFVDSGSSAFFLPSGILLACPSQYSPYLCPPSTVTLAATLQGGGGGSSAFTFDVANAQSLFTSAPNAAAYSGLGAENNDAQSFDFGLPFFYGRTVYTAIENKSTPGGIGPYVAF